MRAIDWDEGMSVGLARLDDDHKQLIAIINRLHEAVRLGGSEAGATVARSLQALADYTERHFAREEAVLEAVGYPALRGHRVQHDAFVDELRDLADAFDARRDPALAAELGRFLRDWLTHHILVEDMAYKPRVQGDPRARAVAERFAGRGLARSERAGA
ncbi:MAG: bacteriohemerythrin [Marivibrio sp.]|uniref:bacteriohemerythrin n=1 Tax=Marivibrio sp. TaxID=2039719 RepID=UPI0032EF7B5F